MAEETLMTGQDSTDSGDEQTQTTGTDTATEETQTGTDQDAQTKETETETEDKGGDENGEEKKKGEEEEESGAPDEYTDFTLPEGFTPDETTASEFKSIAKELDLTQEQAQKLVDYQVKLAGDAQKEQEKFVTEFYEDRDQQWLAELKNDKEVGGEKFTENTAKVQKAFNVLDPDGDLRKDMVQFQLDKWPNMYKAMFRMANLVGDDVLAGGDHKHEKKDVPGYMKMGWEEVK